MPVNDVIPDHTLQPLKNLAEQLPGLLFQLHRSPGGRMHFPYLVGSGRRLLGVAPERLAEDASLAFEQLDETDYPRWMASIERSARWQTPLMGKFRLSTREGHDRWIAVRAQPEEVESGTLWHGIMLDISEQVAEEERLRLLSDTDPLTGLANRRKLLQRLDEEISLSNRHALPLSLVILDLDHFKHINDSWGHLKGDDVLINLAHYVRDLLRREDFLGRLGGEEFALVLPLTARSSAENLAERLRQRIAAHDFALDDGTITVSMGIAEHRIGEDRNRLLERADNNLYAAKHQGRNQVVASR
ncbi:diguanylate cyclase [Halomonas sabkhae]|uniref:GGDEF domain-containing protein n=1 Tax=Halomonas sabkhae TaxID=626223 RepID=UPI0025B45EEF|nr:diguanylate cyclase [Halomonas sabkhae]MDN3523804.1 diguanylate cyclase [Halomonas sabkhae]